MPHRFVHTAFAVAFLLTATAVLQAEVADKLWRPSELLVPAAVSALLAALLIPWRWYLGIPTLLLGVFRPVGALSEILDPQLGPAITREVGSTYLQSALASASIVTAGLLVGILIRAHSKRRRTQLGGALN
jgi:hypothetical protein